MRVIRSALLAEHGFAHGFSLRQGGVSGPPFDGLNLAFTAFDAREAVDANRRVFASEVGFAAESLFEVSQVHGASVRLLAEGDAPEKVRSEEADALVSTRAGSAIAVRVADCVPILVADPRTGAVAAVHAGWRGCVAGIVPAACDALAGATGTPASFFVATIGPHIRRSAFEVGDEVAEQLAAAAPDGTVVERAGDRFRADLTAVVMAQLSRAGVHRDRLEDVGGCTYAEPARFFSYRRDGQRSGRHLAAIVARGTAPHH